MMMQKVSRLQCLLHLLQTHFTSMQEGQKNISANILIQLQLDTVQCVFMKSFIQGTMDGTWAPKTTAK